MRRLQWAAGGLTILALSFALGPQVEVSNDIPRFAIEARVDEYLHAGESRFEDLTPGTSKEVIWRGQPGKRTALAVVYIHGFSATRMEVSPLCDSLASTLKANLFYTRLAGHGRAGEALGEVRAEDWLADAVEAIEVGKAIGDQIVLVGNSTGATLAAWLLTTPASDHIAATVLMSPNFGPRDSRTQILLWPWGGLIAEMIEGESRSWKPHNAEQARYWTTTYPTRALLPMMGLVDLVFGEDFSVVRTPALFLYSPKDMVVDAERVKSVYEDWGSTQKQIVEVESEDPSGHILAGRIMSPATTHHVQIQIESFLARVFMDSDWLIVQAY